MVPAHQELDPVYVGQPWQVIVTLYTDQARTTLFDLTDWTALIHTTAPALPITLDLNVDDATITLSLTREQTAVLRHEDCAAYAIELDAPDEFDGGLLMEGPLPILQVPAGWCA